LKRRPQFGRSTSPQSRKRSVAGSTHGPRDLTPSGDDFVEVFFRGTLVLDPFVAAVAPSWPNERQVTQQGLFLLSNMTQFASSFEACLKNLLRTAAEKNEYWLHKIEIAAGARDDLLRKLFKMSISYATLFPGLDGFARSLTTSAKIRPKYFGSWPEGEAEP